MTNCVAKPLSRQNIRKMAMLIRKIEGAEHTLFFDIVHFLEHTLPKIDSNFTFSVLPKEKMGECHGLTFPEKNEIQIREDVYERALNGSGRDRFTMAHELFHLLQHDYSNISFARMGDSERLPRYKDPEWQADAFGGELLIPYNLVQGLSADQIMDGCQVSAKAANFQLMYV